MPGIRQETCEQARQRLSADLDRLYRIRTDARTRAIRAGIPGITAATDWQPPHPLTPDAPDPIGDFLRAEADYQPVRPGGRVAAE